MNYSKQRETVLEVLKSTKQHPTAAWVYEQARKKLPNISLGTVYRNLSSLQQAGNIVSLGVWGGFERFDADISEHLHFHCNCCHSIVDLPKASVFDYKKIEQALNVQIKGVNCVFDGICNDCLKNKNFVRGN